MHSPTRSPILYRDSDDYTPPFVVCLSVAFYVLLMALIVLLRDITALVGRISARIAILVWKKGKSCTRS